MEREETVLHFLSAFSEHKRNEYPRMIGVMIIKKTERSIF